jgi:ubiquinone/menaquinone biosynthesis C-methylase UbiE
MVRTIASIFAALAAVLAGAGVSLAQTATHPPTQHEQMGGHDMGDHDMSGQHGMDVHHSFGNVEHWVKEFDDPSRDAWQKPDEILDALHLRRADKVADIGAGTGYFSVRIAKRVPDGKVFAVDIEPDMVRYLGERAKREHLSVVAPVQASAESPNLPEPVDLVLIVDTYHHMQDRIAYFKNLAKSLQPDGRVAIIDFKVDAPEGPAPQFRNPPEKVSAELDQAGYTLVASHPFLPMQYFLVFQRKAS